MLSETNFVPNILLCGDEREFFSRVGQQPFKIVGRVQLFGEVNGRPLNFLTDGKIFLNGEIRHFGELLNVVSGGGIDYLVFNAIREFLIFRSACASVGFKSPKVITLDQFKTLPREFFYDVDADPLLLESLKNFSIKTLLDIDGYFAKGRFYTKGDNDFTEIDCVSSAPLLPIKENIYRRVYKNVAEVGFRRYDAVLLVERPPTDFMAEFVFTEKFSDRVITFARKDSELEKYLLTNAKNFSAGNGLRTATGTWFIFTRRKPPEDFCVYVVTHKNLPPEHVQALPAGYKIIHAGKILGEDLGYAGDDTGDNVSDLNSYINELTALYWIWKNTSHTTLGLCHYRRFFTESGNDSFAYEKILTQEAALKLLERYDIVAVLPVNDVTQRENIIANSDSELGKLGEALLKKYLLQAQPDYLDAFDLVWDLTTAHGRNMFITRREIFDAYCKWLFSFLIDATREILRMVDFKNMAFAHQRIIGFFAERMLTVWMIKNRLRIKELKIMEVNGL